MIFVVNHAGFFLSHRLVVALAAGQAGFDVHVVTPNSRHVPLITEQGLPWHPVRIRRSSTNAWTEILSIVDLIRVYRRLRPAIVHHVTTKALLYGTIAARLTGVPAVVNALAGLGSFDSHSPVVRLAISAGFGIGLRHPHSRMIFQNSDDRALFIRKGWCASRDTVLIPGSGVDVGAFRPEPALREEVPEVVLAARMLYSKGILEFVQAAGILARQGIRAKFLLVGEPDPDNPSSIREADLRTMISGMENVEYLGRRSDVHEILKRAAIACLPTTYGEGIPKFLIEGAACGLPLVATDVPGCRDVVRHGENGLLVPPGDADALASSLRSLLEDSELRDRMGAVGRERCVREWSLEVVTNKTLDVYRDLLN